MPDSKKQRRFMGMVHATQAGDIAPPSPAIAAAANTIPTSVAKEIGSASEKGLPEAAPKKKTGPKWGTTGKISGDIKKKAF
jgi:hypothetical protein